MKSTIEAMKQAIDALDNSNYDDTIRNYSMQSDAIKVLYEAIAREEAQSVAPDAIGCKCSKCGEWKRSTPSGMACKNWHGGVGGLNVDLFTRPAPAKQPLSAEREAPIECLREHASFKCIEGNEKQMVLKSADMLAADADEIAVYEKSYDELSESYLKAQQVAVHHVPMPISNIENYATALGLAHSVRLLDAFELGVKSSEKFHGIGVKP